MSTAKPGKPATTFVYDGLGQLTETHEPTGGGVTTTHYDSAGRVDWVEDPLAHRVTYGYLANGLVHTVTGPSGAVTTFGYDALGRRSSMIDPTGVTTTTTFTPGGRTATTATPTGTTTSGYDAAGRPATTTDPLGGVAHDSYTIDGDVATTTSPAGLVTTFGYNAAGRRTTVTDPAGVVDTTTYSLRGEVLTAHRSGRGTVSYSYNPDGTTASVTDARGNTSTYAYDGLGRRTGQTDPLGDVQAWTYDSAGEIATYSTPAPITGGSRPTTTYGYDSMGHLTSVADPSGRTTTDSYDRAGRLTGRAATDGTSTELWVWTYDAASRVIDAIGPGAHDTTTYDAAGRTLTATTAGDRITSYGYDSAGRLATQTEPDGTGWTFTRDANDRVTAVTPLLTQADTFTAPDGTVADASKWSTNPPSSTLPAVAGNRLVMSTSSSSANPMLLGPASTDRDIRFDYRMGDVTGTNETTLGVWTRVSAAADRYQVDIPSDSTTATVRKNVAGVVSTLGTFTLPSLVAGATRSVHLHQVGTSLAVSVWDPTGGAEPSTPSLQVTDSSVAGGGRDRLSVLRTGGTNTVSVDNYRDTNLAAPPTSIDTITYDPDGRPTTETLPDGTRAWTSTNGQTTTLAQVTPAVTRTTTIGYDAAGAIGSTHNSGSGYSTYYSYDPAGELTRAASSTDMSWTYDQLGRRTTQTNNTTSATVAYTYDHASELTTVTPSSGTATTSTYDTAGRRVADTTGADTTTYAYDPAGRLDTLAVTTSGTTTSQARTYDTAGNVSGIANTTGATTTPTSFDWDKSPVAQLIDWQATGATTTFAPTPTGHTALTIGTVTRTILRDPSGSAADNSAANANTTAAGFYTPFGAPATNAGGNPTTTTPTLEARLGYRGELTLGPLTDLRNRNYQPTVGAFTTTDPLPDEPATPTLGNPYHYTNNNPTNSIDPLGLQRINDRDFRPLLALEAPPDELIEVGEDVLVWFESQFEHVEDYWVHGLVLLGRGLMAAGKGAWWAIKHTPGFLDRVGRGVNTIVGQAGATDVGGGGTTPFPSGYSATAGGKSTPPDSLSLFSAGNQSDGHAGPAPQTETGSGRGATNPPPAAPACATNSASEGDRNVDVYDQKGQRITDIDRIDGGVLWEEKSATWAGNEQDWAQKLADQLERYLRARECLPGYEAAPVGVRMTSPGVEASLRQAIEAAIERFRAANPGVDVRLEFW